jgi:hypothetical protein
MGTLVFLKKLCISIHTYDLPILVRDPDCNPVLAPPLRASPSRRVRLIPPVAPTTIRVLRLSHHF